MDKFMKENPGSLLPEGNLESDPIVEVKIGDNKG